MPARMTAGPTSCGTRPVTRRILRLGPSGYRRYAPIPKSASCGFIGPEWWAVYISRRGVNPRLCAVNIARGYPPALTTRHPGGGITGAIHAPVLKTPEQRWRVRLARSDVPSSPGRADGAVRFHFGRGLWPSVPAGCRAVILAIVSGWNGAFGRYGLGTRAPQDVGL